MGYTNLHDLQRHARIRLIAGALVGGAMFLGGIALVDALKLPDAPAPQAQTPVEPPEDPNPSASPSDPAPSDPTPSDPIGIGAGNPTAPDPSDTDPDPTDSAPIAVLPSVDPTPSTDPAPSGDPTGEAPTDPIPAPVDPDAAWWDVCRNRKCSLVFGDRQRIIMRDGTLKRDGNFGYALFRDNDVVLRVQRASDPVITAHFYGFHSVTKKPALAYVTVQQGGQTKQGILPLRLGREHLELVPAQNP